MTKKLLTPEDLYNFFSNRGRSVHFSAKDVNDEIVVSIKGSVQSFESNEGTPQEGLTPVHLQACHTLENINKTFISNETMTKALPSFCNRPILGYIYKDVNGEYQFKNHAKHVNEDGELIFDEKPVGTLPESCNAHLGYDEDKDKTYVEVDGYIYDEYSFAKEILEREEECAVSIELGVRELSYDAKKKLLVFTDVYCLGVTILGKWEDGTPVNPGMEGSNIRIADFKRKNNVVFSQDNLIELLAEMNQKLDQLTINNLRKEEPNVDDQNTLTTPVEPEVTEPSQPETVEPENAPVEPVVEPEAPAVSSGDSEVQSETEKESEKVTTEPEAEPTEPETVPEGAEPEATPTEAKFTKTFELAHDDIRRGLYELLAAVESETQDYCWIEKVYDNYFIYSSEKDQALYKQNYSKVGDQLAFEGERTHLNAEYLTDDELNILNEMRNNYAGLIEKLAQYESEPEKLELLNSKDYALVNKTEEFEKLAQRENYFSLTVDELKAKCDSILLEYAKSEASKFAAKEPATKVAFSTKAIMPHASGASNGKGRYGTTFVK